MRVVKFAADNIDNELAQMDGAEIDELAFGVIELDREGTIVAYNAAEAEISGRDQSSMVGRDFFVDVAPCTRSPQFEGRFRAGVDAGALDVQFTYVFDYEMTPTEVRVRMKRLEDGDRYWVMIKRM